MNKVYITNTSSFLPNDPIENNQMEDVLGKICGEKSKTKAIILRNNAIKTRYYALDSDGNYTHTNADLTYLAVEKIFENFEKTTLEVLSCGTSTPDQFLPSHAAMVHGLMKNKSVEINSSSGVCNAGMNALKFGYMSIKSNNSKNAICTGSERASSWTNAENYEHEVEHLKEIEQQPIIGFNKDFLRWMLSDGAGAFLLENIPKKGSLEIIWMDSYSYAHEIEACMYAGCEKSENGNLIPWSNIERKDWLNNSVFSIKQDVKLLDEHILRKGAESMVATFQKNNICAEDITYFLPHISSYYFKDKLYEELKNVGIDINKDKWFMNLNKIGNVGAASIYIMLDELFHSGQLKTNDTILLSVPESGRFSYTYAFLKVC
jgi:3-oxoacyl-[acyl-carrier-protein] synthase III